MSDVRRPVVAGTFYPGTRDGLARAVDTLLREAAASAPQPSSEPATLRGMVVPHAGYMYSGHVAATAYALLGSPARSQSVVVILGPSHFEPLRGLCAAPHVAWSTPLGQVSLDERLRRDLVSAGGTSHESAHRAEHSIEVQLPFLQRCRPRVPVLPVAVGRGSPVAGAELLAGVLPDDALLVVSTDLSHYHDAPTARRLDAATAGAVERMDIEVLGQGDACGVDALRVAMAWARLRGFEIRLLDLRNSADTAGDPARVVGYGAFAILEPPAQR